MPEERALERRLAALEAEVAELRRAVAISDAVIAAVYDRGYEDGRAARRSIRTLTRSPRPRHLNVVRSDGVA